MRSATARRGDCKPGASALFRVLIESVLFAGYMLREIPLVLKSVNTPQGNGVQPPRYSRIQVYQRVLLVLTHLERVYVLLRRAMDEGNLMFIKQPKFHFLIF